MRIEHEGMAEGSDLQIVSDMVDAEKAMVAAGKSANGCDQYRACRMERTCP